MNDSRHERLAAGELDARLRRDLPAARRLPSEELVAGTLTALELRPAPRGRRPAPRARWSPPAWTLAAALTLLVAGALWAWVRGAEAPMQPVEEPAIAAVPPAPGWLAPDELLASLERGAQAEGRRLVRDLDRVREAVWGDLPWARPLERALEGRAPQPSPR